MGTELACDVLTCSHCLQVAGPQGRAVHWAACARTVLKKRGFSRRRPLARYKASLASCVLSPRVCFSHRPGVVSEYQLSCLWEGSTQNGHHVQGSRGPACVGFCLCLSHLINLLPGFFPYTYFNCINLIFCTICRISLFLTPVF